MKRIKKFVDYFDLNSISESRVYFLNDLNRKLQELLFDGNEWAGKLIQAQGKDIDSDTTFLTLDGENFSFSKEADLKKVLSSQEYVELFIDKIDEREPQRVGHYLGSSSQNSISSLSNRGRVKMGRVIKKMLPEIPDRELEVLVNSLKSETAGYEIKLVKGDDIAKYYRKESCDPKLLSYGTLQSSCMMDKQSDKPHIFDIYTKNPESCQLAIMLNSNGQLVARALVWKIDEIICSQEKDQLHYSDLNLDWETFRQEPFDNELSKAKTKNLFVMDRVYFTKDWMENAFYKWANEKGFMMKTRDGVSYKGEYFFPVLNIKVNKLGYRQFPYLDTFKFYKVQDGILSNRRLNSDRGFELTSTQGEYYPKGTNVERKIDRATNYVRRFKDIFN